MKRKNYKVFILIIFIILTTGCSKITSKKAQKHLTKKYNEEFTYIKVLDAYNGWIYGQKENSWTEYQFKSNNDEYISVSCTKEECTDNYYSILKREDMINLVDKILIELNIFTMDYKYYLNDFDYCNNQIKKETSIYDALKIDSIGLYTNIKVFIKESDYNNNLITIDEVIKTTSEKYNLSGSINIYTLSNEDYYILNTDNRKYIYDYITKNELGTSSTYRGIKKTNIYKITFTNKGYTN